MGYHNFGAYRLPKCCENQWWDETRTGIIIIYYYIRTFRYNTNVSVTMINCHINEQKLHCLECYQMCLQPILYIYDLKIPSDFWNKWKICFIFTYWAWFITNMCLSLYQQNVNIFLKHDNTRVILFYFSQFG